MAIVRQQYGMWSRHRMAMLGHFLRVPWNFEIATIDLGHDDEIEEIQLRPEIWWHDAVYHEADHCMKWPYSAYVCIFWYRTAEGAVVLWTSSFALPRAIELIFLSVSILDQVCQGHRFSPFTRYGHIQWINDINVEQFPTFGPKNHVYRNKLNSRRLLGWNA